MKEIEKKRTVLIIASAALIIIFILGFISFAKTRIEARKRFKTYEKKSQSLETSCGKISFIDEGEGISVLSVHGICGGFDQAYDTAEGFRDKIRLIAPGRFGYTGSNLPANATIEMQVQAFVELLDYLYIDETYVLATSAGSTAAIKFALMHPERTKGLILYCSGFPATQAPVKEIKYAGPPSLFCHDLSMWLISPLFKPLMGMDRKTLKSILPMKKRKAGIIFDAKVTNTVMINDYEQYDLSALEVPVLIIHSKDDKLANFNTVEPWISRIKDCTFVPLEDGGHLMEGNEDAIRSAVDEFLEHNCKRIKTTT